ncbi:uncharacterized protein LAESUDRAFT_738898 [Laetiporus sulphureus 93-53]|uniref:Uncharacterized protein n=1 Tax=Laetiporus sulphureus 93-53 TaxID=1314785 RepID=A0A165C1I8_9APHY|nr:uncharacterized protein LAESUDRAFT_738898 [Laetiporus sulphureus 93-53]KZT02034.1 hypothetical protein LAESUDRAFT_738898 [Laetiporus sulphureus 93-53]
MSGAMLSKVGNPQVYNDGDQRPHGREAPAPFEAGQRNAHDIHDPKDSLTLQNRMKREEKEERERDQESQTITDPLEPATRQGHEPSRGAQIDAELQREDEEMLAKKQQ